MTKTKNTPPDKKAGWTISFESIESLTWIAVFAAWSPGQGSSKRSVFSQSPVALQCEEKARLNSHTYHNTAKRQGVSWGKWLSQTHIRGLCGLIKSTLVLRRLRFSEPKFWVKSGCLQEHLLQDHTGVCEQPFL